MSTANYPDTSIHEALPSNVTPTHYSVHLYDIDYAKNTFTGLLKAQFDVNEATSSITLHQKFLEFTKASAVASVTKTRTEVPVKSIDKNDDKETVDFVLDVADTPLTSGQIELEILYSGKVRTDMAGFYTSNYKTDAGETEYVLVTQFEAAEARSAFPCYDEPNKKATFDISMVVEKEMTALSNMPLLSSKTLDDGKKGPGFDKPLKLVKFETTPKMSTYLVAWSIGKYEYVEAHTEKSYRGSPLPIRVYTIPGQSETGRYALSVAQKDVDFLSKIFDVDYPLPKLDLLAVPQFGANAMENWGMVTFRATALLYDEEKSDRSYQQNVAYVVSHEIAHSWFGNYVTMNWWSDLWLNESFATFVGELSVDEMHPEWGTFTGFVTSGLEVALDLDSLRNSHPIEVQVNTAAEIDEIFDHISYLKGGSIIRMVAETVGVKTFLAGVSKYLKKYAFGNAKSDDLWKAVSEVSGKDITTLVAPWIRSVGFPYVSVSKKPLDPDHLKVSQHRFFSSGKATKEEDSVTWWIPNCGPLAYEKSGEIPAKDFAKANVNTIGFYRVVYDDALFQEILEKLSTFSSEDKIGLVGDTSAAAQAGLIKTSKFLELVSALKDEEDVNVWIEVIKRLNALKVIFFSESKILESLSKFSQDLFKSRFDALYSQDPSKLSFGEAKLRSLLFTETGAAGLAETISDASKLATATSIDPSLRLGVYKTLLGNESTCERAVFDTVLNEVKNPSTIDSIEASLKALGSISKTDPFLKEVLGLYFSPYVLEMNYSFLTNSLVQNPHTKVAFWEFFKENYPKFRSDVAMWTLDRLIKTFLPFLVSESLYKDITLFFGKQDTTGYSKGLNQGLDAIKNGLNWSKSAKFDVALWLKTKGY